MKTPKYYRIFDYDRRLLPNAHLASLEDGVSNQQEAEPRTGLTIGYPGWGLIYYVLMSHLDRSRFEFLVETGSNIGCTTIVLAQALQDTGCQGKVATFEISKDNADRARENLASAGLLHRVEIYVGDSRDTLPAALNDVGGIRFAFLDASHLFDDVMAEFEILLPKLEEDALVIFDNTYQIADEGEDPRVNGALRAIEAKFGGNLINLEFVSWYTPGLAIWQKCPRL